MVDSRSRSELRGPLRQSEAARARLGEHVRMHRGLRGAATYDIATTGLAQARPNDDY